MAKNAVKDGQEVRREGIIAVVRRPERVGKVDTNSTSNATCSMGQIGKYL